MSTPNPPSDDDADRDPTRPTPYRQEPYPQSHQPNQPDQPEQPTYGQPEQPTYGQPEQPAYGQPEQPTYGQPEQPEQPTYGQQPYPQVPPAYGQQPAATTYGQQPWNEQSAYAGAYAGGAPYAGGVYAGAPQEAFASWGKRVGAWLIDFGVFIAIFIIGYILSIAGAAASAQRNAAGELVTTGASPALVIGYVLIIVNWLAMIGFCIWNRWIRQGRTGQTVGKQKMGIKLVRADNGQPFGAGMCFVRDLAHYVDGLICYIGYLWPLWDSKRQTLADKICSTVVVPVQPGGPF